MVKLKQIKSEILKTLTGITELAFIVANGTAAYVLWFSTSSLTLQGIAVILAIETSVMALKLSRK
jgi:hypothetical protein